MSENPINPNQLDAPRNDIEQALAQLVPRAPTVDRDQLMYQAGWAAATASQADSLAVASRQVTWLWPASTGVMVAATLALALMLVNRPPSGTPPVAGALSQKQVPSPGQDSLPVPTEQIPLLQPSAVSPAMPSLAEAIPHETPSLPLLVVSLPRWIFAPATESALPRENYLTMRAVALERGIDAWPVRRPAVHFSSEIDLPPRPPLTARELLKDLQLPKKTAPRVKRSSPKSETSPASNAPAKISLLPKESIV